MARAERLWQSWLRRAARHLTHSGGAYMGRLLRRSAYIGAMVALLPGLAAGVTKATADPNPGARNYLYGVKALSPTGRWAATARRTARPTTKPTPR